MPGDIRKFFEPAGPAAKKKREEVELAPGGGTPGNALNQFPMPKNLGIDTKIKSVACSEPKLQFWPI